jgi:hypothetical protein
MLNENAKWIWLDNTPKSNEYAVFEEKLEYLGGTAIFTLCAETDYLLQVNGKVAGFCQFAGYPFQKYYEEIDITKYLNNGENTVTVTVRYEGYNSATHIDDGSGVIYSLNVDDKCVLFSSKETKCGYDDRYIQYQERTITVQLGFTVGMRAGGYKLDCNAKETGRSVKILPRPVKKAVLYPYTEAVRVKENIYDLGRETAGYLRVKIKAENACTVQIAYGEHLENGQVPHKLGARDFTLDFALEKGEYEFTNYFVRIAGRYLQALLPEGASITAIGIIPVLYPLTENEFKLPELDQKIYDTCVRTLRLCMNNHYEDCPWREQALYVLDSRNQMLSGYYAFKETEFPRAMLQFIAKGTRADGFLELTYPAKDTPAIPFFSVMYPVAVYEYIQHTGDKTVLKETFPTMLKIMENCKARIEENGLIHSLENPYWNFYEWSEGAHDPIPTWERKVPYDYYSLILNAAFVYSGTRFKELCIMANKSFECDLEAVKSAIIKNFHNEKTGLFFLRSDKPEIISQLGNAFALLIGLGDKRTVEAVRNDKNLVPATLSMLTYVYDALLSYDEGNKEYVLNDIREKYGYMLDNGATSFWETLDGASAFGGAASLCHGWSALPIYYYHKLLK